jgi:hypothetical protein
MKLSFRGVSTFLVGAVFVALACFTAPNCQPTGGDLPAAGGSHDNGNGGSGSGGKSGDGTGGKSGDGSGGKSGDGSGGKSGGGTGGKSGDGTGGKSGGGSAGSGSGSGGSSASGTGGSASGTGGSGTSASGTGGSTTASTGTTGTGDKVTISGGKGVGAMLGYGWVSFGSKDTVTDPTCGGTAMSATTACASTTWSTTDSLCISGSIPALPASPTDTDYSTNWGMSVGLNATEPAGSGIGQTFSTIAVAITGGPAATSVRVQVHIKGDPDGTSYCIAYSTGALSLSKFAQDCYNTTPTKTLPAASIPSIDKVSVQVISGSAAVTVTKLCITGITFGK